MDKLSRAIVSLEVHFADKNKRLRNAWAVVHAKLVEGQKPTYNNASMQLPRTCEVCILNKQCDAEYAMEQCWRNAVTAYFA